LLQKDMPIIHLFISCRYWYWTYNPVIIIR